MYVPRLRPFFLLAALACLAGVADVHAQSGEVPPLDQQLAAATEQGDDEQVADLVRQNRLAIQPIVTAWLTDYFEAAVRGDAMDDALARATAVAHRFAEVHGERSLVYRVEAASRWDVAQYRQKLYADSLYASASELRRSGDTREVAVAQFLEALALYEALGDRNGVAQTLGGLGFVHWYLDRAQYLTYNEQALTARRAADDQELIGNSLSDLGLAHRFVTGDLEQALAYYREAEDVRLAIGDSTALPSMYASMGRVYEQLGRYDDALTTYRRLAEVGEALALPVRQGTGLRDAGVVLTEYQGRHSEALPYFQRALAVHEAAGDEARVSDLLNWLGITHRRLGDYESALGYYQQVIRRAQEADDAQRLGLGYNNLTVVYQYAGRHERAVQTASRAVEQFEALGDDPFRLRALLNLASSQFDLQTYEDAEATLAEALPLSRSLRQPGDEARALVLLGNVLTYLDRYEEALKRYGEAKALTEQFRIPEREWIVFAGYAENYERQGRVDEAITYYERAFDTLERMRGTLETEEDKANFLAQQRYVYEAVVHLLSTQHEATPDVGYDAQAFRFAERAKARAFLDLLAEAIADVRAGIDPALLEEQQRLVTALALTRQALRDLGAQPGAAAAEVQAIRDSVAALEESYQALERAIRTANPRYSDLQYPQPSTLAEVQASLLDDDTVLLEYALGDSSSTLWIITPTSRSLHLLPPRDVLEEEVDQLRFTLTSAGQTDPQFFAAAALRLYEHLLAPADAHVRAGKHLIVVPDGALHYVPFEALLTDAASEDAAFGDLAYVVRRSAVSYGPSASVLHQLQRQRADRAAPTQELLALGDPIFAAELAAQAAGTRQAGPSDLARLPYTGDEVRSIAGLFPAGGVDVLLRDEATEDRFRQLSRSGRYRYVHLATHGLINERRPDFSGIALTPGQTDTDGLLQVAEIFNLSLDADLVVLSACETGLGQMVRGEGLVGLTRAFIYAGTPSVVVSLWSVADRSTAQLMEQFYRSLTGNQPKAEALRTAKLALLADDALAHPFNWAPFVIIGDRQ